jgi:hypothetical protein
MRIAFEASGSAHFVDGNLSSLGYSDIPVARPKNLPRTIKSEKKNDNVDSGKLATLHLMEMIQKSRHLDENFRILHDILI